MSCYQLIKTMTKFEKRTNHRLIAERLNVVMNAEKHSSLLKKSAPQQRAQNDAYCPITSMTRIHCPINAQIGLLIANHVRKFCYSFGYNNNNNNNNNNIIIIIIIISKSLPDILLTPFQKIAKIEFSLNGNQRCLVT